MTDRYSRAGNDADPPFLSPDYKSTVLRSPRKPLIMIPQTLSEITGPVYGHSDVQAGEVDLTRQHAGEPQGERIVVKGRVLDEAGRPIPNTLVEIWQCNAAGRYHHPRDDSPAPIDPLFRAYGVSVADAEGRCRFRTVRPVPYPGRTPHLHLILSAADGRSLTTQLYVRGEPGNARDGLFSRLTADEQARLSTDFVRGADAVWQAVFQVVLAG